MSRIALQITFQLELDRNFSFVSNVLLYSNTSALCLDDMDSGQHVYEVSPLVGRRRTVPSDQTGCTRW